MKRQRKGAMMVRRGHTPPAKGQTVFGIKPFKVTFNWGKDRRKRRPSPSTDLILIKCRRLRRTVDYEFKLAVFGIYLHLKVVPYNRNP